MRYTLFLILVMTSANCASFQRHASIQILEVDQKLAATSKQEAMVTPFNDGNPGQRISVVINGADLKQVLLTIAQLGRINITIDKEVWGENIKARFINVPWDMALASLIQSHNLSMKKLGNIYRIGLRDKLSSERDNQGIGGVGKTRIKTHFIALNKAPATEVAPVVKELLLSPWGSVLPYAPGNLLIVRDEDKVILRIKDFVTKLENHQKGK